MGEKRAGLFIPKGGRIIPAFWSYDGYIRGHIFVPSPNLSLIFLGIELGIESLSRVYSEKSGIDSGYMMTLSRFPLKVMFPMVFKIVEIHKLFVRSTGDPLPVLFTQSFKIFMNGDTLKGNIGSPKLKT